MPSGIYAIQNMLNGRQYIGSAVDLKRRWHQHITALRYGRHHSRYLQCAFRKYGEPAFAFRVLFYCDKKDLILFEQRAMDALTPKYNISPRAGSCLGVCHTEKVKASQSKRMMGHPTPGTVRAKIAAALNGHAVSEETIAKLKCHHWSEEERRRIGVQSTGRIASEETRAKMSVAHKGHELSRETRAKISIGHKGCKASPETIEKLRQSHLGQKSHLGFKHSSETRTKISAAVRAAYESNPGLRERMSEMRTGRKASAEARANMSAAQRNRVISSEEHAKRSASIRASWAVRRKAGTTRWAKNRKTETDQ